MAYNMKAGTITAKLRDAVQVRFFEDGAERVRFKNIEIPDALKALEIRDFSFDVPTDASDKITFRLFFDDGILPTEFPPARPRITRAEKAAKKQAAQEADGQTIPEAELVQIPSGDSDNELNEERPEEPAPTVDVQVNAPEMDAEDVEESDAEMETEADEPTDIALPFNVTGAERRALAEAVYGILGAEYQYKAGNARNYYIGGGYIIDKDGTLTGAYNAALLRALEERGYAV
jgi:hypothetical protein